MDIKLEVIFASPQQEKRFRERVVSELLRLKAEMEVYRGNKLNIANL